MAAAPQHAPNLRHSLSVHLLGLVVVAVLLIDLVYFMVALQHEWHIWMRRRLEDAQLVVSASGMAPLAAAAPAVRTLSGLEMIRVLQPDPPRIVLAARALSAVAIAVPIIDIDRTDWFSGLWQAAGSLHPQAGQTIALSGTVARAMRLELAMPQKLLARHLDRFALRFLLIALSIALALGGLLAVAVRGMLVAPLLRIARSISAFRADPERALPLDAAWAGMITGGEIGLVGRELSVMQTELRTALWRNARLAAVGTAVAKMSHDLRGILSSAMLVADRLTMSQEAATRQSGEIIMRSVQRATVLAQHTLDFVREGPTPAARSRVALHSLIEEAGTALGGDGGRGCRLLNQVDPGLAVDVDRDGLLRVLTNLLRNADQAGARCITVSAAGEEAAASVLSVADDGPGLPAAVLRQLFRPFNQSGSGGSGLGLAIARDLMWAHGGDLRLAFTGPQGTCFALYLQQPKPGDD